MRKRESRRVQRLPTERLRGEASRIVSSKTRFPPDTPIQDVAAERPSGVGEVRADLVRAARVQLDVQERDRGGTAENVERGHGPAAFPDLRGEPLSIHWMSSKECIERLLRRWIAVHQRAVVLLHAPALEARLQAAQRRFGLRHHEAPARVLVEAMDDAGPLLTSDAG